MTRLDFGRQIDVVILMELIHYGLLWIGNQETRKYILEIRNTAWNLGYLGVVPSLCRRAPFFYYGPPWWIADRWHVWLKWLRTTRSIYQQISLISKTSVDASQSAWPTCSKLCLIICYSKKEKYTVVPVLVGSLNRDRELMYGDLFAKYLNDPSNLFVISSDFCHWGKWALCPWSAVHNWSIQINSDGRKWLRVKSCHQDN